MKRRRPNHLASAAVLLVLLAGGSVATARHRGPVLIAASQCTADTDCKGDRVCNNGKCVEPQPATPPAPKATVPKPGPAAVPIAKEQLMVCSDDADCGAGLVCRRGDCLAAPPPAAKAHPAVPASTPSAQAPAAPAPAVAAPAVLQPGRCVNDVDCAGDAVCNHGACVFPTVAASAPATTITPHFKTPNILSSRRGGAR